MPQLPVHSRQVVETAAACLRGLLLGACLLLASGAAQAAINLDNPNDGGSISVIDTAPTLDERNAASLKAAADAAAQSILNSPDAAVPTATQLAPSLEPNAVINDKNPYCNQAFAVAYDEAQQKALTIQLGRDSKFFEYAMAGAYAGNCVGRMIEYAQKLSAGVSSLYAVVTAGDPLKAAITLAANQILQAVFRSLVASLENQICSITNQITSFSESVLQNAVCIPSGSLQLGGLFNFNTNLNLPNLQCDGLAINPLQLANLDPANGQPSAFGEGAFAGGVLASNGNVGNYSGGVSSGLPPIRGFGIPQGSVYGDGDSTDISGEPTMDTGWSEIQGPVASGSVGSVCASGGDMNSFIAALGNRESGNGKTPQCQNYSRVGLNGSSNSPYTCINSSGFVGKYQFGEAVLHDLAARGIVSSSFLACQPYPSKDCFNNRYTNTAALTAFLNNPTAQEAAIRAEMDLNWNIMSKRGVANYIGKTINGVTLTKSGLLAAAHLIGAGGLMNALNSGKLTADGNGVSWLNYAALFANC